MIYLVLFIFFICLSYNFDYLDKKRNKNLYFYLSLIILILLAGFRYRIGLDTVRYEYLHESAPLLSNLNKSAFEDSSFDPLYLILSSIAKTISPDFWVLQILQSILVNTIVFRFIRLNTKNIFLGILLYYVCLYLNFNCEVMREACAVSMLLLGWEYLKKDKIIIFTIFCILACGFHISAIVLLIIPILKLTNLWGLLHINKLTIPLLIVIFIIATKIQTIFFDQLALLSLGDSFTDKVALYADTALSGNVLNVNGIISVIFRYILLPLLAIINIKKSNLSGARNNLEQMVLFSLITSVLLIPIAIFYRYLNYFFPFAIIAICEISYRPRFYVMNKFHIKGDYFRWYLILFPLLFFSMYGYKSNEGNSQYKTYMRYYPYSSIITEEKDNNRENLFMYYNIF